VLDGFEPPATLLRTGGDTVPIMTSRAKPIGASVAVVAALAVLAAACGDTKQADANDSGAAIAKVAAFACPAAALDAGTAASGPKSGKLQVVTTVAPITSIVANVAGDRAVVVGVIPEGEDSHTYEPKPSVAAVMNKADVVFVNGLKLEDPTKELATQNAKGAQVVELGTLTINPDEYIYDFSFPKADGKPNPHLWTNPPMAACYARIAASAMGKADPTNASYYKTNADAFVAKVDKLDALFKDATATMPAANRKLLTYHDAYAYFAAHYGWKVIGAIQVSSFEDPTPKEVARLIDQIKKEKVPAIFGSEVFPSPVLAQIGKEAGVTYVDKLRDDDLPGAPGDADHSFLGLMKFDFVTMVSALGGDASKLSSFDSTDVVKDMADYPQ
jgi:ABC-type Zn uptake system ZnuABC Zn-binding protein ZnuA